MPTLTRSRTTRTTPPKKPVPPKSKGKGNAGLLGLVGLLGLLGLGVFVATRKNGGGPGPNAPTVTIIGPDTLVQNTQGDYVATATSPLGVDLSNAVDWSVKIPSMVTYSFLTTGASASLLVSEVGTYSLRARVLDPVTGLSGEVIVPVIVTFSPPPPDPVVNVGIDQAVTLDVASHAEVTITFSVVSDNPVNLEWSHSGPGPVTFSPLSPNQELAEFSIPGTYLIRLTATDATDNRAQGFDELVVTVNEILLAAILVPGQLTVDGFANYTLTREMGDTISFVWPVTNVGDLQGAAFIQLTEAGAEVGTGAPFPIDPGQTVNINFNPVVSLSTGVHSLVATVMEGLPPDGIPVGDPQSITLRVVSIPVLSAVGNPTINGIPGATSFTAPSGISNFYPAAWDCQNSGGGVGRARLRVAVAAGFIGTSPFIQIPGFSTVTLLVLFGPSTGKGALACTLTMEDEFGVPLGQWQFIWNRT